MALKFKTARKIVPIVRKLRFFTAFLRNPRVGATAPSSSFVVEKVLSLIPEGTKTVIELGPGDGVVTRELLKALPKDGHLTAIELDRDFASKLRRIASPNFTLIEGKAEEELLRLTDKVDMVIASIPFSMVMPDDARTIIRAAHALLRPRGRCVVFHQYWPVARPLLRKVFGPVESYRETRNNPSCYIFWVEKK